MSVKSAKIWTLAKAPSGAGSVRLTRSSRAKPASAIRSDEEYREGYTSKHDNLKVNESFKEAYVVLQRHAQTLREQRKPSIDNLLSIVTESVQAYKICQQRIEAVEKALEKALSDTGAPTGNFLAHGAAEPAVLADDPDDIPF